MHFNVESPRDQGKIHLSQSRRFLYLYADCRVYLLSHVGTKTDVATPGCGRRRLPPPVLFSYTPCLSFVELSPGASWYIIHTFYTCILYRLFIYITLSAATYNATMSIWFSAFFFSFFFCNIQNNVFTESILICTNCNANLCLSVFAQLCVRYTSYKSYSQTRLLFEEPVPSRCFFLFCLVAWKVDGKTAGE